MTCEMQTKAFLNPTCAGTNDIEYVQCYLEEEEEELVFMRNFSELIFKEENDMQRNNIYDLYNYNPVSGHVDGQKGEACTERDNFFPPVSYYASVISHLLSQPEASSGLDPAFLLPSSQKNELLFQSGGNNTFSKEASALSQLPFFGMSNSSQFGNEHLQAKRARVENIIRGMNIMPSSIVPGTFGESGEHHTEKEKNYRENKRKQKLPHQQSPHETPPVRPGKSNIRADEHLQRKKQLHVLQHQMKQLGKKFLQPCSDACQNQRSMEKTVHLLKEKLGQCLDDGNQAILSDQNQNPLWRLIPKEEGSKLSEKEAAMMGSSIPTSEDNTLSEILKHELIQVVTQAVDSVLKKVLPNSPGLPSQLCNSPLLTVSSTGREFSGAGEKIPRKWFPNFSSHKGSTSRITEKPPGFPAYPISSKVERTTQVNCPLIMTSEVQRNDVLSQMLLCSQNGRWGSPPTRIPSSPESIDVPWQPVKLKSSVMRQRYPVSLQSTEMENLASLVASKAEFSELCAAVDEIPFPSAHVQEALTPGHLRKAKLMFFFTRYPSSSLLKAYFLDVQFTRCITSQLIKWFSNFREFYYIQMEKFARQALLDGITDPNDLLISRDSELFRILNTHYNKGNDFEVPDGFLDVASLTLQEFFGAIRGGKDLDPSWKKPIYKIISKLDSKIPDTFKSSSCLQETVQG
ncbi:prospero homeobox protein 2 [Sphaerodactylus townsendi]|uniref:prospero homeobox protein 2 n=1 Tax=Sphaerodactylus townsendi TaxID=933632 RepID=UPI002026ADF0|nr:prospero homeobox protein 2 [Sphaerodactylus townsendi]